MGIIYTLHIFPNRPIKKESLWYRLSETGDYHPDPEEKRPGARIFLTNKRNAITNRFLFLFLSQGLKT